MIVLESPHVSEFKFTCKDDRIPLPAIGNTGNSLEDNLMKNIKDILEEEQFSDGTYSLILANAIPYQCSLGLNTKMYRDRLFTVLWFVLRCNEVFLKRIEAYKPMVIINLCTIGDHSEDPTLKKYERLNTNLKGKYQKDYEVTYPNYNAFKNLKGLKGLKRDVQFQIEKFRCVEKNECKMCFTGNHPSSGDNWNILKL